MAYTTTNYRTGKALKEDFKAGKAILVYQPGPFGSEVADGKACIEGPHYPEPHRWYLGVTVKDGRVTAISK